MSNPVAKLDTSDVCSVRAYALHLSTLINGLPTDPGLVIESAGRFERFILSGSQAGQLVPEHHLQPLLEPECLPKAAAEPAKSESQLDRSSETPVSGLDTETVAEPEAAVMAASGGGDSAIKPFEISFEVDAGTLFRLAEKITVLLFANFFNFPVSVDSPANETGKQTVIVQFDILRFQTKLLSLLLTAASGNAT